MLKYLVYRPAFDDDMAVVVVEVVPVGTGVAGTVVVGTAVVAGKSAVVAAVLMA